MPTTASKAGEIEFTRMSFEEIDARESPAMLQSSVAGRSRAA